MERSPAVHGHAAATCQRCTEERPEKPFYYRCYSIRVGQAFLQLLPRVYRRWRSSTQSVFFFLTGRTFFASSKVPQKNCKKSPKLCRPHGLYRKCLAVSVAKTFFMVLGTAPVINSATVTVECDGCLLGQVSLHWRLSFADS